VHPETTPENHILALADRCVKCGLCLPQCPTYNLTFNESESPRGRIALIQAVVNKQLNADAQLLHHLDTCLLCQRCERVCPSGVEYGKLMDNARALLHTHSPTSRIKKMGLDLLQHPKRLRLLGAVLYLYQKSRIGNLLNYIPVVRKSRLVQLQKLLPKTTTVSRLQNYYPAIGDRRGQLVLFAGCMGEAADNLTLSSSIQLLTRLGYDIHLPEQQTCCGAMHQHSGESTQALSMALQNIHAVNIIQTKAIVYTSSGCGAQLKNYTRLNWCSETEQQQAHHFSNKVMDVSEFLAAELSTYKDWHKQLAFAPLDKHVVIHQPCSQRNVLRLPNHTATLLEQIPGIKLYNLPDNTSCCGAAGDYMLRHPRQAQSLRSHLLNKITEHPVEIIATSNLGCALFLNAGVKNNKIELMHPVTLLANQLTQFQGTSDENNFIISYHK